MIIDGYTLPEPRDYEWYPAIDDAGEIIYECYTLPMHFVTIISPLTTKYILLHLFVVSVLGMEIGCSRVEFPTLDASNTEQQIALVKLYRAKEAIR